jgi:predicted ATP-binding protein involved in virulence
MFLRSVRIKNFRGFGDLSMSFVDTDEATGRESVRKTSILVGNNGTGKSNLLKAIGLVTAGRSALAELLGDPSSWIQNRKTFCQIDASLSTQKGEVRKISLRIDRGDKKHEVLDKNQSTLGELDNALEHAERSYFVLGYGASRRLNSNRTPARGSSFSESRARCLATLFNSDALLHSIEAWAMDLDYQKDRKAMSVIQGVLSTFLRDVKFEKIDKKQRQLMFRTSDGIVPLAYLSDGYQNVAAWIGDLLFRVTETFEDYTKPLHTRGLLLVDEIDLHLHPVWQKELLDFLQRQLPKLQIVATTHSPITAQQAGVNELFFLKRNGKASALHQFSGDPRELLLHQIVMSEVFGMKSDESANVEKMKGKLVKLRGVERLSSKQSSEKSRLEKEVSNLPVSLRSNAVASQEQITLLKQIHSELGKKK